MEKSKMMQNTLTAPRGHWDVCQRWAESLGVNLSFVFRAMVEELSDRELSRDGPFVHFTKRGEGGNA